MPARITPLEVSYGHMMDLLRCVPAEEGDPAVDQFLEIHSGLFSPRTQSTVSHGGLRVLLHNLEQQLHVSETDVEMLEELAKLLEHEKVMALCKEHRQLLKPPESPDPTSYDNPPPAKFPPQVYEVVSKRIGRLWRDLGNKLKVPQAKLDIIAKSPFEGHCPSNADRAKQVLLAWSERRVQQYRFSQTELHLDLVQAVRACRPDLADDIKQIIGRSQC